MGASCFLALCALEFAFLVSMQRCLIFALLGSVHCFAPVLTPRPVPAVSRGATPMMGGAKDGPFTPIVKLTKRIVGDKAFLPFRAKVISKHTEVIQAFVETSDSPFGCMALQKLFEIADVDGNGTIDREELKIALQKLGFTHLKDAQIDAILKRADDDDNCVLDYDEFVKEAPKTLKVNLVKLAKSNGADLGFLS